MFINFFLSEKKDMIFSRNKLDTFSLLNWNLTSPSSILGNDAKNLGYSYSGYLKYLIELESWGTSSLSDNKIGIAPSAIDSQNLIEFGPEPDGQRLKILSDIALLYSIASLFMQLVSSRDKSNPSICFL